MDYIDMPVDVLAERLELCVRDRNRMGKHRVALLAVAQALVSLEEEATAKQYKDWQVIAGLPDIVDAARDALAKVRGG